MFNNSPKRFRFVSARLIEVEQDFRRNIIIFFFNPLNDDILHDLFKRKFKSRVATNICKAVNNFLIIPDMTIEFQKFRINKFLIAPSTRCVIKVFQIFRI